MMSRICAAFRVPYLVHLHGSKYRTFYADASPLVRGAVISLFRGATSIVVLGSVWRDFVASEFAVPAQRVTVVPNGTPALGIANCAGPNKQGPLRIAFSGRLSVAKGIRDLLEAADAIQDEALSFELVLMGDSRDSALLHEASSRSYCTVTGWLSSDQVVQRLMQSDIFILPSYDEGLPMAMIEAMSLSLPVIVTDVGAVSDVIVDGQEGYLVDAGDTDGLRAAMRSLLSDRDLREAMGLRAQQRWSTELRADRMTRGIEAEWNKLAVGVPERR
jgi:glycosyltransferase involved in cell wall biosynthesis